MNIEFVSRLPVRIYYEDTDAGAVVYHANYLKFYERARTEWLRAQGLEQNTLKSQHRLIFVVAEISTRFIRPVLFDELIEVVTSVGQTTGTRLIFTQRIERDNVIVNTAEVGIACVDVTIWRAQRIRTILDQLQSPTDPIPHNAA